MRGQKLRDIGNAIQTATPGNGKGQLIKEEEDYESHSIQRHMKRGGESAGGGG